MYILIYIYMYICVCIYNYIYILYYIYKLYYIYILNYINICVYIYISYIYYVIFRVPGCQSQSRLSLDLWGEPCPDQRFIGFDTEVVQNIKRHLCTLMLHSYSVS